MKAVIPVAAKKETMFPLSESRPTGLMPVMDRTVVGHLIDSLEEAGVDEIYLVTNYMQQMFRDEFRSRGNVEFIQQEELSGTARAVQCCDFLEDEFIVVNGDVMVSSSDLENLVDKYRDTDCEVAMLATDEEKPEKFGVLSITNDMVSSIEEKPERAENTLVNTGIYMFSPAIFDYLEQLGEGLTSITDAVNLLVEEDTARFELVEDYWLDIGSPRKLWKADRMERERSLETTSIHDDAEVADSAEIGDKVRVDKDAEIRPGTVLEGPCYVAENVTVGPNTVIRDSTVSRDCRLRNCDIDSALFFEDVDIDPHVSVTRSVIGEESEVRPGTVIQESYIGPRSFIEMNNSILGTQFVPDARTDLGEISK